MTFYISIMTIGIFLTIISFGLYLYDKKKGNDDELRIDGKKEEIIKIIQDADLMIDELNKFSDYIVSEIDKKNDEMMDNFEKVKELINGNYNSSTKQNKVVPINLKYNEVLKMSKAGFSYAEIAKRLDIGKGEIELILGVNKKAL